MTAAEKITSFSSLNSLIEEIDKDRHSTGILNRRYAVRFIMLDNFDIFKDLVLKLTSIGIKTFDLVNLLDENDKDSWITKDKLTRNIKILNGNYIISPFSEIARFYEEDKFRAFFNEISLLENPPTELDRRIYIPLIGLESRFMKFLDSFGRIEESAPVWRVKSDESQPVTVYITPYNESYQGFKYPKEYKGLETMYDWLTFWKNKAPTEKIICSSFQINVHYKYSQPDNIFDIKEIKTAFQFITEFLNIPIDIEYKTSESNFWVTLLASFSKELSDAFSFKKYVHELFNVFTLTVKDVLNIWSSDNVKEYDRWVLKNYYLKYLESENDYLTDIIKETTDYYKSTALLSEITLSIFDKNNIQELSNKRKRLLNLIDKRFTLSNSELEILKNHILEIAKIDTSSAINLSTGRFDFEKLLFIGWYKCHKMNYSDLQNLYPDFAKYLSNLNYDSWANNYIQDYKNSKLLDEYSNEIKNHIELKNASEETFYKWYYDFKDSKDLLALHKPDKVYWLDGVGIEYLSLIKSLINDSQFKIKKLTIARTTIPSSTEHNRFEGVIKKSELDTFIHSDLYKYPESLCKGIDIVKQMVKDIINETAQLDIAIVSDHGLTCLSRLVESKKYTTKSSHEGRYIPVDSSETSPDSDYIRCKNNGEYFKVALTHASLNTKPVREVHGGCTPEEVLVPFIFISNKPEMEITYSIQLLTTEISIISPLLKVKVSPDPNNVSIRYNGENLMLEKSFNIWETKLVNISIGLLKTSIIIDNSKPLDFEINVMGGIVEEDLF